MRGEDTPILGKMRKTLLQPRMAIILLACAVACVAVVEIFNHDETIQPRVLEEAAPQEDPAVAKEPVSTGVKLIRKIPIVGARIADWAAV